jgi:predicted metal-dependent hydrolase
VSLEAGLGLVRDGRYFEAHEVFEELWRAADAGERDFYQGLVHVAVAPYQQARDHQVAMRSQLAKARRRLAPFAPAHRGVDVAALLAWADRSLEQGRCDGPPPVSRS